MNVYHKNFRASKSADMLEKSQVLYISMSQISSSPQLIESLPNDKGGYNFRY